MTPLNIRFDGAPNVEGSSILRLPKLNQGAPYSFSLRIRNEDNSYRSFAEPAEIRMRMKLRPADVLNLMVLTKTGGNFVVSTNTANSDTLSIVLSAASWNDVIIPLSSNHMEMDTPFSFVIEFLNSAGVVTERFAQGTGLISVSLAT